jgi:glucose-6-phosphate 1-dehydrogenase
MVDKNKPLAFILFGITGDLSQKKIIPAIYNLYKENKLPKDFYLVGFSRKDLSRTEFEKFILSLLPKDDIAGFFLKKVLYLQGDFFDVSSYKKLLSYLSSLDQNFNKCFNKIFHLAIPPDIYSKVFKNIYDSGLSVICRDIKGESFSRLLVEKPFGQDYKSSLKLNDLALKLFDEKNIFRIDHYNAKDFVDKIRKTKFDYKNIKKIEINLLEEGNVSNRGAFYDSIGALSDVVQNHIFQMLSFVALNKSRQNNKEKAKFFNSLLPRKDSLKIAQYKEYKNHIGVRKDSSTETYFEGRFTAKSGNLKDKEIFISSGKNMKENKTEVRIYFKDGKEEIISSTLEKNNPYEKVILQSILGKKDIFVGKDEVLSAWKLIDRVKKDLKNKKLEIY